jgi:uncharacterized protein
MSDLVVRRLLVDLETPFPARWHGGDAFRSALFNALSMSFPVGEQYFIDSVRTGIQTLTPGQREPFAKEVQGFIGQEATHRRIHSLFNQHLADQGYTNEVGPRAERRAQATAHHDPRNHVAATAATEHFTAVFADWMMNQPMALDGAPERLKTLWLWHSAEESEHRSTAFDVYTAMGGSHAWRVRVFKAVTVIFLTDIGRQTVRNLWHDGSLFNWRTWRSGAQFLFARNGMIRSNVGLWKAYLREDFHPSQLPAESGARWLQSNASHFRVVGAT